MRIRHRIYTMYARRDGEAETSSASYSDELTRIRAQTDALVVFAYI